MVLNSINNIPKNSDNVDTLHKIIISLNNIKSYLLDYITHIFDKTSYLDNNTIYIKYINAFRTIKKVLEELKTDA